MKIPRLVTLTVLLAMGAASIASAGPSAMWTNYATAVAAAKGTTKPILLNFCSLSPNARQNQFSAQFRRPEFYNYAGDRLLIANVVMSGAAGWVKQHQAELEQSRAVANRFGVGSTPTVLIVSPSGAVLGQLSSPDGTIDDFLKRLDAITKLGLVPYAAPTPEVLRRGAP